MKPCVIISKSSDGKIRCEIKELQQLVKVFGKPLFAAFLRTFAAIDRLAAVESLAPYGADPNSSSRLQRTSVAIIFLLASVLHETRIAKGELYSQLTKGVVGDEWRQLFDELNKLEKAKVIKLIKLIRDKVGFHFDKKQSGRRRPNRGGKPDLGEDFFQAGIDAYLRSRSTMLLYERDAGGVFDTHYTGVTEVILAGLEGDEARRKPLAEELVEALALSRDYWLLLHKSAAKAFMWVLEQKGIAIESDGHSAG